jgi:hypothetical protein
MIRTFLISAILAISFLSSGRAFSQDKPPAVALAADPTTIPATYREDQASGHIHVAITQGTAQSIMLRSRPAKLGDSYAPITFKGNGKDSLNFDPQAPATMDVPIVISKLTGTGLYEGTVEAVSSTSGAILAATKVSVVRSDASFAPVVTGDLLKNGRLEFSGAKGDQFVFTVQNPTPNLERTFTLSLLPLTSSNRTPSGDSLVLTPPTMHLRTGQEQQVFATLNNANPSGKVFRAIRIAAEDDPNLFKDTLISLKDSTASNRLLLWLFLLVLAGALLSVAINNVFPVSITKSQNRVALTQIESDIKNCTTASGSIQTALLADAGRLRLLNGQIQWYQPSNTEKMQQLDRAIVALKDRLEVATAIRAFRLQVQQANLLPITVLTQIEEKLSQAEDALLNGQLDNAKSRRDEAAQLRTAGIAPSTIAALRDDLKTGIQALAATAAPQEGRNPKVAALIEQLKESAEKIPSMSVSALLDTERDYNVAHTYVEVGERALKRNPGDAKFEAAVKLLFGILKANPASLQATQLALLIDSDLTPADIATAVGAKKGRIVCDPKPRLYELTDYRFEFTDPRLAAVPVALRLTNFEWNFKDNTSPPHYDRCKHFYVKQKKHIAPWKNKQTPLTIEVAVTPPSATTPVPFTHDIILQLPQGRGQGVIGMQILSFAVTSLVALCAAFGTQYSSIPEALTLSAALSAVLFGFGLDQIRSKASIAASATPPK